MKAGIGSAEKGATTWAKSSMGAAFEGLGRSCGGNSANLGGCGLRGGQAILEWRFGSGVQTTVLSIGLASGNSGVTSWVL